MQHRHRAMQLKPLSWLEGRPVYRLSRRCSGRNFQGCTYRNGIKGTWQLLLEPPTMPISSGMETRPNRLAQRARRIQIKRVWKCRRFPLVQRLRSEERRVGKECRSRETPNE